MGRGFSLGANAAAHASAPLFVISAGLGVVPGTAAVPSYGLTVGTRTGDAIGSRAAGSFDPATWWQSVANGPFSAGWRAVIAADGLILVVRPGS